MVRTCGQKKWNLDNALKELVKRERKQERRRMKIINKVNQKLQSDEGEGDQGQKWMKTMMV